MLDRIFQDDHVYRLPIDDNDTDYLYCNYPVKAVVLKDNRIKELSRQLCLHYYVEIIYYMKMLTPYALSNIHKEIESLSSSDPSNEFAFLAKRQPALNEIKTLFKEEWDEIVSHVDFIYKFRQKSTLF